MGMEFCIYKTEQAENRYVFQIIKKFMENGTVKNMKKEDSGIQVQELSYFYAHKNKSFRIVNIIDGSDMVGEALMWWTALPWRAGILWHTGRAHRVFVRL